MLDKVVLRGITNISKVNISQIKDYATIENGEIIEKRPWVLYTDGINLLDVMNMKEVDATRTFSNDIHEIYETFGIEAARYALIKEITDVISRRVLNYRHIALLCDIMTAKGNLMSIDRHGINRGDIGLALVHLKKLQINLLKRYIK